MAIERQQMRRLDRSQLPAVWAYRTEKKVFGRNRTVLVTFNQQLFNAQQKTLTLEINKRKRKLEKLQDKLQRTGPEDRGKKPSVAGIENNVKEILPGRHMKDLFSTQVTKTQEGLPRLRFQSSGDRKVERGVAERRLLFETLPLVAEMDVEDFGYACGVVSVEAAQRCWCVVESGLGA
jgi:hypothetical protein